MKQMNEKLLEYYTILNPNVDKCKVINDKKIKKPELVSMMLVYWSVEGIDPSVVL
jgi:hydroxymethylpyrimidine/phosphomethylpyrimidine kinase